MLCFDPDKFAVVGEQPMTRMDLPGKPWAAYGLVREVRISPDDLPYLMISFSTRDIGTALGLTPHRFHRTLSLWGWNPPKYPAKQAWMEPAAKGLTWREVNVYTYPEAEVLLTTYSEGIVTSPRGFGKKVNPEAATRVNEGLLRVRQEMETTYD